MLARMWRNQIIHTSVGIQNGTDSPEINWAVCGKNPKNQKKTKKTEQI